MKRRLFPGFLAVVVAIALLAGTGVSHAQGKGTLLMATTTSTDNTGLLEYLAPKFKEDTGIELLWVSVGTGAALALGENCDVSVLLVHAPGAEKEFMEKGYGAERTQIMYNDYIILGPKEDPAKIKGKSVVEALKAIQGKKARFASRGDNSGTHKAEQDLWKQAGIKTPDKESWYLSTGQGMLNTINIAAEQNAYTLADRGTFIKYEANFKGNPPLVILVEGEKELRNQYSVIPVNPERCPTAKYELAREYAQWMASEKGQRLIAEFKVMGKQLFYPNAGE
ncbi:MAG: substrate-binding domain-containing protein [Desulfomonilia bacterium]|jgi:tungstate transport system substrate-binding protein